ncbi:MAG: PAS domain S-box protein [Deltaproteobacteria bacterium]|nr:PAS domain S-box protein [Deltaproteobacteria bacterium]
MQILDPAQLNILLFRIFFISPSLMALSRVEDNVFVEVNHRFIRFTGYSREEIMGHSISELNLLSRKDIEIIRQSLDRKDATFNEEIEYRTKSGDTRVGIYSGELIDITGEKLILSVLHDITERRNIQNALKQRERELTQQSAELEEANSALRTFLKRLTEDQKNLEARLQQNIDETVIPYIRELQNYALDERGRCHLNILEANLKDIFSPFLNNMSSDFRNLTPMEIQVANMVRGGMTSKNIADLLNITVGTVNTHRNNIRKKLGLKKGKTNLRSYLLSMS